MCGSQGKDWFPYNRSPYWGRLPTVVGKVEPGSTFLIVLQMQMNQGAMLAALRNWERTPIVYLQRGGFSSEEVAAYIALIGVLSVFAQTLLLSFLMKNLGNKHTIMFGLSFQLAELAWYGFASQDWMLWGAGTIAAMCSVTYPSVSALISKNAEPDQQGVVQGMVTGIRGLCNGLGPALFGFIFYIFHVDLDDVGDDFGDTESKTQLKPPAYATIVPGPPFLFGACLVLVSLLVVYFVPVHTENNTLPVHSPKHLRSDIEESSDAAMISDYEMVEKEPLMLIQS
ncbi:hippocampus abundant transcript-like protein 1 [Anneissia japonica]|uniref:hippocampus abundant transcript-like protein 1 n=1 Tax=Anneissia japonica TaxID=1529436 RepID=UPI0014256A55|nr:hippocampus abundant transcript-like protein 1 [Anneissia japonica]